MTEVQCTTKDIAELGRCSATEALRRDVVSIDVGDDEEIVLSPNKRQHHRYFARVRLEGFEDLQALGLVPRRIKQKAVREALAADDEQAFELAEERVRRDSASVAPCHCHEGERAGSSFGQNLRATFRDIRRDYNPALARVLSGHFGTEFAWDSTLAASVRGWTRRLTVGALVTISMFEDITIGRNGRLELDPTSTVLLAGAVRIHRTGTLIHRGAYLRIWANSIESFLVDPQNETTLKTTTKIWALER